MRPTQATAAVETPYSKSDLNNLVLNFLIIEGYESAAQRFAAEAGLQAKISTEHIHERLEIRTRIHRGELIQAIQLINELNPELLDTDPALHFMLLRLHLIELIKQHLAAPTAWSLTTLLEFAGSHLAPRAATDASALADLEQTMALLCFAPSASNSAVTAGLDEELQGLLDASMRTRVAERVNEGLLQSQGIMRESKLRALVRLFIWGEKKCGETADAMAASGGAATGTEGEHMVLC